LTFTALLLNGVLLFAPALQIISNSKKQNSAILHSPKYQKDGFANAKPPFILLSFVLFFFNKG
jgi:hypothetical protein